MPHFSCWPDRTTAVYASLVSTGTAKYLCCRRESLSSRVADQSIDLCGFNLGLRQAGPSSRSWLRAVPTTASFVNGKDQSNNTRPLLPGRCWQWSLAVKLDPPRARGVSRHPSHRLLDLTSDTDLNSSVLGNEASPTEPTVWPPPRSVLIPRTLHLKTLNARATPSMVPSLGSSVLRPSSNNSRLPSSISLQGLRVLIGCKG